MPSLKPGLNDAWLGSFNVITDIVIDKESYSNAPCIRHGAARLVIGGASSLDLRRSGFFTILKGTRRRQLLRLHGACSVRAKPVSSKSLYT
jgi:hypothetical protein